MMKLDNFVGMMTGHFDNKDQFNKMQAEGKTYPYAEHVNTICNDKINNLPEDFKGKFVVEDLNVIENLRKEKAHQAVLNYYEQMSELGYDQEGMIQMIKQFKEE